MKYQKYGAKILNKIAYYVALKYCNQQKQDEGNLF